MATVPARKEIHDPTDGGSRSGDGEHRPRRARRLRDGGFWRLGFPFGLAALVLLSTIGRRRQFSDDFIFGLRDPVTGAPAWPDSIRDLVDHFGRPLHLLLTPVLQTVFWNHQWAYHLLNASTHIIIGLMLYRLARRLGLEWRSATIACAVFLFFPYHYEVIFWSTSLVIALSVGLLVALLLVCERFASKASGGWWLLVPMALLAFAVPCFYEQPSGAIAALPFIYLIARPRSQRLKVAASRMALSVAAVGAATLTYAVLKVVTAPPHARGAAGSITPIDRIPERIGDLASVLWAWIGRRTPRIAPAAIEQAIDALRNPYLLVPFVLILGVGVAWMASWIRNRTPLSAASLSTELKSTDHSRPKRAWMVVLCGLAIAVGSWLPHVAIESAAVAARSWYITSVGLGLILGGLFHALLAISPQSRLGAVTRIVSASLGALLIVGGSLIQIGWADAMRLRSLDDTRETRELADAVGEPEPWAVFVPLVNLHQPTQTGEPMFDRALASWTQQPWITPPAIRHAMHRSDVHAIFYNPWSPVSTVRAPSPEGWAYRGWLPPHKRPPGGDTQIAWESTIPFIVDKDGRIQLIDRLVIESLTADDFIVDLPHVRDLATPGATLGSFVLREWNRIPTVPPGFEEISRWRLTRGKRPRKDAIIAPISIWSQRYETVRLDLNPTSPPPSAIATRLVRSSSPRRAVFRATIPPHLIEVLRRTGPQVVTFTLEGAPQPLASLHLDADAIDSERRWLPVAFDIPPISEPTRLIVELTDTEPGGPPLPILLTRGIIEQGDR